MGRPPKKPPAPKTVLEVEWPFFGELCRSLALKVWHEYQPDLVVGIARAGVIPGAVTASIMRCDFASITLRRSSEREAPALISRPTQSPKNRKVLLMDATCASGDTMRLALSVMREEGAKVIKTAVAFKTGEFRPDYSAMASASTTIILPWDRDVIEDGEIVVRPDYEEALRQAGLGK
jgi:hypoxanthine phosphoribosyltransferase